MSTKGTNITKDVIYIDVDDEITAVIDKLRGSSKKIVALVLPKRATVLQSVVNMKLLKRAAADAKKNLVLITAEAGLLPLAGSVGVHVARNLNSKPEIPDAPAAVSPKVESIDEIDDTNETVVDKSAPVGRLAGDAVDDSEETIELDDEDADAGPVAQDGKPKKVKKGKFKIPDFNKFRLLLALSVVGVILLSVVGYAALAVWPTAIITIKTNNSAVGSSVALNLKTNDKTEFDAAKAVIKATPQEVKKTLDEEVPATGEKNNGKRATGEIKIINCTAGASLTIPAGTVVSSSSQSFTTDSALTIPVGSTSCFDSPGTTSKTVAITASKSGAKSNIPAGTFVVSGYSSRTEASSSAATTGGTDEITKVVASTDVEAAKQKITEQDDDAAKQELQTALIEKNLFAVEATFKASETETKLSTEVGEPAESVTVTQTITYTMLGVNQEELEKIISKDVESKIDTKKQSIIDYGLDDATFALQNIDSKGATLALETTVVAGAELSTTAIKKQVAGQKAGGAKTLISANPGVTDVDVTYSPFWVSSIPKKTSKITVIIEEPKVTADDTQQSP
jgi:hypothetical protein